MQSRWIMALGTMALALPAAIAACSASDDGTPPSDVGSGGTEATGGNDPKGSGGKGGAEPSVGGSSGETASGGSDGEPPDELRPGSRLVEAFNESNLRRPCDCWIDEGHYDTYYECLASWGRTEMSSLTAECLDGVASEFSDAERYLSCVSEALEGALTCIDALPNPEARCEVLVDRQFVCDGSVAFRCNGTTECAGGEDEADCPEFECTDGSATIPRWRVCDGWEDCTDNSDEKDCMHHCAEESQAKIAECPLPGASAAEGITLCGSLSG